MQGKLCRTLALALATFGAVASAPGCGDEGSYELTWTIGCAERSAAECAVTSVQRCAAVGLDTVAVTVVGREVTTLFPCYSPTAGALGRGPALAAGPADLAVSGRNAAGQTITGPTTVSLTVPETGLAPVEVDLPRPRACADGVDDDGDGMVDLFDPECSSLEDDDESQ